MGERVLGNFARPSAAATRSCSQPYRTGVMRYGPNLHELDPAVRRKPTQSLKKAAPGAPFGWCKSGAPYIGTQYCVRGSQFASLSTRNGGATYYWKPLSTVSKKVALSAIDCKFVACVYQLIKPVVQCFYG